MFPKPQIKTKFPAKNFAIHPKKRRQEKRGKEQEFRENLTVCVLKPLSEVSKLTSLVAISIVKKVDL